MTLTATPISATPKSDIEFRYGTTIYTLKAPQEATAVPIDGKIGL